MASKIALITGASGGIGAACAQRLAREGYTVLMHGHRGFARAQALAQALCAQGLDAHALRGDLRDSGQVRALCGDVLALYHRVDALVLCAGVAHTGLLCDMTDEQWHEVMEVNVSSAFYMCRELAPGMVSRGRGSIVTVSSMWGRVGASCEAAYSAAKAGVIGLTKALAKEEGPSGIRVNCLSPGVIDTPMNGDLTEADLAALREETPLGRTGTPEETAQAAAFLLEQEFITGQVLGVSGGMVV